MALDSLEVILFVILFGIDAYAYGNLNEIRRVVERLEAKLNSTSLVETTRAVMVHSSESTAGDGSKAGGEKPSSAQEMQAPASSRDGAAQPQIQLIQASPSTESPWQSPALEHEVADMRAQQRFSDDRLRELEAKLDEKLSAIENAAPAKAENGISGGQGDKIMSKLDDVRDSVRKLGERVGEMERDFSAHLAESQVERSEVMQKISDTDESVEKKFVKVETNVRETLKKAPAAAKAGAAKSDRKMAQKLRKLEEKLRKAPATAKPDEKLNKKLKQLEEKLRKTPTAAKASPAKADKRMAQKLKKLEKKLKQVEIEESALAGQTQVGQSALLEKIEQEKVERKSAASTVAKTYTKDKKAAGKATRKLVRKAGKTAGKKSKIRIYKSRRQAGKTGGVVGTLRKTARKAAKTVGEIVGGKKKSAGKATRKTVKKTKITTRTKPVKAGKKTKSRKSSSTIRTKVTTVKKTVSKPKARKPRPKTEQVVEETTTVTTVSAPETTIPSIEY